MQAIARPFPGQTRSELPPPQFFANQFSFTDASLHLGTLDLQSMALANITRGRRHHCAASLVCMPSRQVADPACSRNRRSTRRHCLFRHQPSVHWQTLTWIRHTSRAFSSWPQFRGPERDTSWDLFDTKSMTAPNDAAPARARLTNTRRSVKRLVRNPLIALIFPCVRLGRSRRECRQQPTMRKGRAYRTNAIVGAGLIPVGGAGAMRGRLPRRRVHRCAQRPNKVAASAVFVWL